MADDFSSVLRGRPSLRRRLRGYNTEAFGEALSDIDPKRFKGLYRDRLSQLADFADSAAPIDARMKLEEQLKDNNLTSTQRDILNDKLRRNPASRYGSLASSNDPYRYGSLAQAQFGSLFRR